MKALVYTGPEALEFREMAEPVAGPGEAVVRIEAVGICGSDMHAYFGRDARRTPPLILGHEAVGIAESGRHQGRRVAINPLIGCGICLDCLGGRENICATRQNLSIPPRQGAFAQYLAVPERNLVAVPDGLEPDRAALAEPMATALHAVRLAARACWRPLAEAAILVLGGGAIGLSAALVAASHGARGIRVAEPNALRRRTLGEAGFAAIDPGAGDAVEADRFDLVVDAVGTAASREAASRAVRRGGVIAHIGLGGPEQGLDMHRLTLAEVTIVGCYTYTMVDFTATVSAMAGGALSALDWIDVRPLADGAEAFRALAAGQVGAAKIILKPGG